MKPKNFTLIVLLLAIVGAALWWFTRSTQTTTGRTSTALSSKPIVVTPPPTSQMPVLVTLTPAPPDPAPQPDTTPRQADTLPPIHDPQADLKTAIPDIVRLYRAGDVVTFRETYTPPGTLDPNIIQQMRKDMQIIAQNPQALLSLQERVYEPTAQAMESLENQTPSFNAIGDEATYMFKDWWTVEPRPVTFIKINGKWFIKSAEGN